MPKISCWPHIPVRLISRSQKRVELFEARKPRETAIIAEINGLVKYGEVTKGQRKIYVVGDDTA